MNRLNKDPHTPVSSLLLLNAHPSSSSSSSYRLSRGGVAWRGGHSLVSRWLDIAMYQSHSTPKSDSKLVFFFFYLMSPSFFPIEKWRRRNRSRDGAVRKGGRKEGRRWYDDTGPSLPGIVHALSSRVESSSTLMTIMQSCIIITIRRRRRRRRGDDSAVSNKKKKKKTSAYDSHHLTSHP